MKRLIIAVIVALALLSGCNEEDSEKTHVEEYMERIKKYKDL